MDRHNWAAPLPWTGTPLAVPGQAWNDVYWQFQLLNRSNGSNVTLEGNAEGGKVSIDSGGSQDHLSLEVIGRILSDGGGNRGMRFTGTRSNPTSAILEPTLFEERLVGGVVRFGALTSGHSTRSLRCNTAARHHRRHDGNHTPCMGVIPVVVEALKAQRAQFDKPRKEIEALKNQFPEAE